MLFAKYAGCRKNLYSENAYVIINLKGRRNGMIKDIFRKEKLLYYAQELKKKKSYAQLITEDIRSLTRHFRTGEKFSPFKQVK